MTTTLDAFMLDGNVEALKLRFCRYTQCGKTFMSTSSSSAYCSRRCKQLKSYERLKDYGKNKVAEVNRLTGQKLSMYQIWQKNREEYKKSRFFCKNCQTEFIPKDFRQRVYCSSKCSKEWDKSQHGKYYINRRQKALTEHREFSAIRKLRRKKNRIQLMSYLGGPKCLECLCEDFDTLQFHHINNDGDADRMRIVGPMRNSPDRFVTYYLKHVEEAKQKLQVLCQKCNIKKNRKYDY